MKIWLVTVGEPLPIEGDSVRLLRTGLLAQSLVETGHTVTWWSSSFNHVAKKHFVTKDTHIALGDRWELILLHGRGYRKNIGLARMWNHWRVGRKFRRQAQLREKPDIILCSFPTIELSYAAAAYGRRHGVPVILDVRDLWPDIFLNAIPTLARPVGKWLLRPLFRQTRQAFQWCTGVVGTSKSYLDWGLGYATRPAGRRDRVLPIGYHRRTYTPEALLPARDKIDRLGIPADALVIWFCGIFATTYDLQPAIECARQLAALHPQRPVAFVFSGDGEDRARYEAMALGLPNVFFTGWLDAREIHVMMERASIGLAAYAAHAPQSLPNKIFEYLSAGLPILSSLTGEAAALLQENHCGLSYDARSSTQLLQAILTLIESAPLRQKMGENALSLYQREFETTRVNADFIGYLEEVAAT